MIKVLFINGIRDDGIIRVNRIIDNNILQYINEGTCNVYPFLKSEKLESSMLMLDANPSQDINPGDIDIIFNQVSDPDTHKIALAKVSKICEQFKDRAYCINHPDSIINASREKTHELLKDISSLIVPRTIRILPSSAHEITAAIKNQGWSYPVLIRHCGDHNAKSLVLLERQAAAKKLNPIYFEREGYLSEFNDYSDSNGVFAKYRFVSVRGKIFVRHVMYSDQWEVHAHVRRFFMKENRQYFEAEKEIMSSFDNGLRKEILAPINEIYRKTGLDYLGVDCSIDAEGRLIIFEANANMNLLFNPYSKPNPWQAQVDGIHQALVDMINGIATNPSS